MRKNIRSLLLLFVLLLSSTGVANSAFAEDPLPSWNEGPVKTSIIKFVERVTDENSSDFVPAAARIATFDNDGTLWAEQPLYFQLIWALDRIKSESEKHPDWKDQEPFKSAISGDMKGLMASGEKGLLEIISASHANITAEEFKEAVRSWLETARHPKTGKRYVEMTYKPMLELLDYLRANQFKTFIVSGGGIDFLRVFSERVYGIPPEQVVGSTIDAKFEMRDGVPTIVKKNDVVLIDDKAGKPVGIYRHIGRRPIFAGGNSDGDFQMLQYTTIPKNNEDKTPRFGLLIHHTDAQREFAYDRDSHIGKLEKGLEKAKQYGWYIVDMKEDWKTIFPASN